VEFLPVIAEFLGKCLKMGEVRLSKGKVNLFYE
jgi:hypothetical protein